jgi:hypothetical protein
MIHVPSTGHASTCRMAAAGKARAASRQAVIHCLPIFIDDHPVHVRQRLPPWPLKGATSTLGYLSGFTRCRRNPYNRPCEKFVLKQHDSALSELQRCPAGILRCPNADIQTMMKVGRMFEQHRPVKRLRKKKGALGRHLQGGSRPETRPRSHGNRLKSRLTQRVEGRRRRGILPRNTP